MADGERKVSSLPSSVTSRKAWDQLGPAAQGRALFTAVWTDYHPLTRAVTCLLVIAGLLGTAARLLGPEGTVAEALGAHRDHVLTRLERGLTSDPMLTLLALAIALLVAMAIKRRQILGLLDGAEHYDIGRALAFGYFRNFLVGALQIAQQRGTQLHVFRPDNVEELNRYAREIWQELRRVHTADVAADIPHPEGGHGLVRRSVVVLENIQAADGAGKERLVDFPTTLYTVDDYYKMWNDYLLRESRQPIAEAQLPQLQSAQIAGFFQQIDELFTSPAGLQAARPQIPDAPALRALRECLRWDTFDEARDAAATATQALAAERRLLEDDPQARQRRMDLLLAEAGATAARAARFPQVARPVGFETTPDAAADIQRQAQGLRDAFAKLASEAARLRLLT